LADCGFGSMLSVGVWCCVKLFGIGLLGFVCVGSSGFGICTDSMISAGIGSEMDGEISSEDLGSSGCVDSALMNSSKGKSAESLEYASLVKGMCQEFKVRLKVAPCICLICWML